MSDDQQTAAFEINGRTYPVPTSFRLIDPVLVREITGLEWDEFVERMGGDDDGVEEDVAAEAASADPVAALGLIAVAVWQAHAGWSREKVKRYVGRLDISAVSFHGVEDDDPPAGPAAAPATSSRTSPDPQSAIPVPDSDGMTQPASGPPPSATTSQGSIPV